MPSGIRLKRISDRIKRILSVVIQTKVEDPRLEGVFVTDVNVDRELEFASIYVSALEGKVRSKEVIKALEHAKGFLKYELSQEIELRVIPKLRFFWDPTPEHADKIDSLIAKITTQVNETDGLEEENEEIGNYTDDECD
jgi:ribosome-binding factor A